MKSEFLHNLWIKLKQFLMTVFKKLTQQFLKDLVKEVVEESSPTKQAIFAVDNLSFTIESDKDSSISREALIECLKAIVVGHEREEAVKRLFAMLAIVPDKVLSPIRDELVYELVKIFEKE